MFNLWLNVVTEFSEKWYVRKYFYMLQILTTAIKQRLYSTTGCITQQIQLIIKYKTHFVRVIKCRQFFCAPDIFLYVPENSDHVQPVVVLSCKHNVTMRILNKTQLILESNLDFRGGGNITPTNQNPEIQPAVEFGLRFLTLVTRWTLPPPPRGRKNYNM